MGSTTGTAAVTPALQLLTAMADVISNFIRTGLDNPLVYSKLCLYLASGVDLANKEVPLRRSKLPLLLKQVYKCNKDDSFRAAFMVLMISIKSACKIGWFSSQETDDLATLAKQAVQVFSNSENIDIAPSYALTHISNIMSGCHPQMKIEKILVSLHVKAGFGAYISDFSISRDILTSQQKEIWLFIAEMENTKAVSDIALPQVNLILNGKTVQEGIKISMSNGPQLSTNVTAMLEDGINLLQAVGQFKSSYIVALATTSAGNPVFHDKYLPSVASSNSGSKEKATLLTVSLNCPISQSRPSQRTSLQACSMLRL